MKYFLHDSNSFNDEKVTELYIQFGYEGLGLFYTLLEKIALQEKPIKTSVLKHQLKIGKRLNKCWSFMEQIGLISSLNGETFNEQLLNFSEKYQVKKEKNRKKISEWREKQAVAKNVTGYVPSCNAPKVKLSKVKESNTYLERVYFPKSKELDEAFKDYLRLRIKSKFTMTDRAINALVNKLRGMSNGNVKDAIKLIDSAIIGKWKSFYNNEKI